jgi:hypothetical protein
MLRPPIIAQERLPLAVNERYGNFSPVMGFLCLSARADKTDHLSQTATSLALNPAPALL